MKKLISFILALVVMLTAVPALFASAEEVAEPEKKFVIDGILDEWYRDDDWAMLNDCYYYYKNLDDTTLDIISRSPGAGLGEQDVAYLYEELEVKIYVAYDDHYVYFYVDVLDSNIATSYIDPNNGTENANSQYIENIDFYVDTDVSSCDGEFFNNCASYDDADTHFRMIAHNKVITDTRPDDKYTFTQETVNNDDEGNPRYDASGYFNNQANVVPFHKFDDAGNLIGYGCEARFPLAYWYGETMYREVYYHIAVTNSATEDDSTCAIATGKRWWLAYDTGKTVYFEPDEPNPFFAEQEVEPDPDPQPPVPTLAMGDINDDKKVDAKDALLALRISVDKFEPNEDQLVAADVNEDEKVDAKDALEMLKYSVDKPSALDKYVTAE